MATVKQVDSSLLEICQKFAKHVRAAIPESIIILYGSAARGEEEEFSDIDIYVEIPDSYDITLIRSKVSDIAWEVGFNNNKIIQPVVYRRSEVWDNPRRSSPFIKTIHNEGINL